VRLKFLKKKPAGTAQRKTQKIIACACGSPGCSSGEEAYSLPSALKGVQWMRINTILRFRFFPTDIDCDSHCQGPAPAFTLGGDVLDHEVMVRLPVKKSSFCLHEDSQIPASGTEIREMVIYAVQNLIMIRHSPTGFGVCWRNLLIYLGRNYSGKVIPLFHYS